MLHGRAVKRLIFGSLWLILCVVMSDFNGKLYYLQKIKNALLSHLACDRGEGETENICDE